MTKRVLSVDPQDTSLEPKNRQAPKEAANKIIKAAIEAEQLEWEHPFGYESPFFRGKVGYFSTLGLGTRWRRAF